MSRDSCPISYKVFPANLQSPKVHQKPKPLILNPNPKPYVNVNVRLKAWSPGGLPNHPSAPLLLRASRPTHGRLLNENPLELEDAGVGFGEFPAGWVYGLGLRV